MESSSQSQMGDSYASTTTSRRGRSATTANFLSLTGWDNVRFVRCQILIWEMSLITHGFIFKVFKMILGRFWLRWRRSSTRLASDADSATLLSKECPSLSPEDRWVMPQADTVLSHFSNVDWHSPSWHYTNVIHFHVRWIASPATPNTRRLSVSAVTRGSSARARPRQAL